MSDVFEYHFTVGDRDADGFGLCRASALLGYLQDAAAGAAENGGFGRRALLEKYGAFWMLARTWFRLERPLRWGEELTVRTWHRGAHGAMMYRDYDILSGSEPVGESVSGWVLAQQESRRLLRLGAVGEMAANQGGELCKAVTLAKLRRPEDLRLLERRPDGCDFKIEGDAMAKAFLNALVAAGIFPERFEIREPSLHEIFVEKVGAVQ